MSIAPTPTPGTPPKRRRVFGTVSPLIAVTAVSTVFLVVMAFVLYPSQFVPSLGGPAEPETTEPSVPVAAAQPDTLRAPLSAPDPVAAPVAVAPAPRAHTHTRKAIVAKPKKVAPPAPAPVPTRTAVLEPIRSAPVVASIQTPDRTGQAPVTITGCLESTVEGDRFRLTETEGAGAPKARGWRSAFLKKSPAPVDLVELPDMRASRKYVGYRVAATGLLMNREMHVRTLESAGPSCS